MIDISDLNEIHPIYCYPKGYTVSFEAIRDLIDKTAREFGVPIEFAFEKIVSGNIPEFIIEDCLVLYHPEHKYDYLSTVFRIRRDDGTAYISKSYYRFYPEDEDLEEAENERANTGKSEAEQNYYTALKAIFEYLRC